MTERKESDLAEGEIMRAQRMRREQARILIDETERAEREGLRPVHPASARLLAEREKRESRNWPTMTRDEAYATYDERMAAEREAEREHLRQWSDRRKAHSQKTRARRRGVELQGARFTLGDVVARDGRDCYLCRRETDDRDRHLEHIIPLSHGGSHTLSNVAVACSDCNLRKGSIFVAFDIATRRPWLLLR